MNSQIVYFNDNFLPKNMVKISPDDRGFLFADGVYEVIRSYYGKLFMFDEHINRLKNNLNTLRIEYNEFDKIKEIILELIRRNHFENSDITIYLQITRGVYPKRFLHIPEEKLKPTVYMYVNQVNINMEKYRQGLKAVSVEDKRWGLCNVKTTALVYNILAQQEAIDKGGDIGIFVKEGFLTEATNAGLFAVKNSMIFTYPESNHILPSITRKVVLTLCNHLNINLIEQPVCADKIIEFDEMFIVGTTPEIAPVIIYDNMPIGNSMPGAITQKLQESFEQLKSGKL
ncbi:MAG: aminotransferase class IV [Marinilabiliales bacterium]